MSDRACQFMPFDALDTLKEELRKREEIYLDKIELCEDYLELLEYEFRKVNVLDLVNVIYYKDGKYRKICGIVSKICKNLGYIQVVLEKIYFKDIYKLEKLDSNFNNL